ncbi:hypothetical protein ACFX2K_037918 [Malus domestica]
MRWRWRWAIEVGTLAVKVFDQAAEFFASRFPSEHEAVPAGNSREDGCGDNCMKECEGFLHFYGIWGFGKELFVFERTNER